MFLLNSVSSLDIIHLSDEWQACTFLENFMMTFWLKSSIGHGRNRNKLDTTTIWRSKNIKSEQSRIIEMVAVLVAVGWRGKGNKLSQLRKKEFTFCELFNVRYISHSYWGDVWKFCFWGWIRSRFTPHSPAPGIQIYLEYSPLSPSWWTN